MMNVRIFGVLSDDEKKQMNYMNRILLREIALEKKEKRLYKVGDDNK